MIKFTEYFLPADAIDGGYEIFGSVKPRTVADVVSSFNVYSPEDNSKELENKRFQDSLQLVKTDIDNYL